MNPKKLRKSTLFWSLLCSGAFILLIVGNHYPAIIDQVYHRGIFQIIRFMSDYTIGMLPFPPVYLLFGLLLILVYRFIQRVRKKILFSLELLRFVRFITMVIGLFYLLWGLNYKQTPVEKQIHLELGKIDTSDIRQEFNAATKELNVILSNLDMRSWDLDSLMEMRFHEREVRKDLITLLDTYDLPTGGRVRGRLLRPSGTLLVWNTAGIYIPFVGEGHIDRGLLPFQYPYVMSHEMSHGYGITDEGSCNFLAYLACRQSSNLYIRFSGVLGYWRYIASEFRRANPERYESVYGQFHPVLKSCLSAIYANNQKYPEFMPTFRYHAYDQYLKAQGIREGMRNYARVVRLVQAWRKTRTK